MKNNKRAYNKTIAEETMNIINSGYYTNRNRAMVSIKDLVDKAVEGTALFMDIELEKATNERKETTQWNIEFINQTTIDAIIDLRKNGIQGNIVALNFASAKNPGGGFLNGASAQEESIMRASALYSCIENQNRMYDYNKKNGTPLYSDLMIYSPNVPIIRNDKGHLLIEPIVSSFITSPAVNAKVARERGINEIDIHASMKNRIRKIINLAYSKKPEAIVLGAYGCGVFGNMSEDVAEMFKEALKEMRGEKEFKDIKVIFAIYDTKGTIIDNFKEVFMKR